MSTGLVMVLNPRRAYGSPRGFEGSNGNHVTNPMKPEPGMSSLAEFWIGMTVASR
jgi:hypothetical protein